MAIDYPQEDYSDQSLVSSPSGATVSPLNAFQLTSILLNIEKIHKHPDVARCYRDVDADTPELKQLTLIRGRLKALISHIERSEVQIGMILIECTKLGLHRAVNADYTSMFQYLVDEGCDKKLLSRSIERYKLWVYIERYNYTQEDIEQANHEQMAAIYHLKEKASSQYENIAREKAIEEGRQWGTLNEQEVQRYYNEAEEEFEHTVKQEIAAIFSTEHPDLHQPEPMNAQAPLQPEKKPQLIIKDPKYDPNSGAFYAEGIAGYINIDQFPAMKRGSISYSFQVEDRLLSMAQYVQLLEETAYDI